MTLAGELTNERVETVVVQSVPFDEISFDMVSIGADAPAMSPTPRKFTVWFPALTASVAEPFVAVAEMRLACMLPVGLMPALHMILASLRTIVVLAGARSVTVKVMRLVEPEVKNAPFCT